MAVGNGDRILVADSFNIRVERLTSAGNG
ncbi:MAG: hypothetical protein JJD96_04710 [Thermoleophilia bacterium]|nr:hypothetical protein [Thermoleophilia bacterium]